MGSEKGPESSGESSSGGALHEVLAARELLTVAVLVTGAVVSAWLGHEGLAMSLGGAAVALVTPLRAAGRAALVGGALVVGGLAGCGGATAATVPQVAHVACAVARPACAVVSSVCAVEAAASESP